MPQIIYDMPADEYHARPEMSNSNLKLFSESPARLVWARTAPEDPEKRRALNLGTAMHTMLLEPHRAHIDYVVMPKFGRKAVDLLAKKEWLDAHEQCCIITDEEQRKLQIMAKSVMAHPVAREMLESKGAVNESSVFWRDPDSGVDCRARPDILTWDVTLGDIKTTPDLKGFGNSVVDYRYYVQAAFYEDGLAANDIHTGPMQFIVIQKNASAGRYPVDVVALPDDLVEYGRRTYKRELCEYAEWQDRCEPVEATEQSIPNWFYKQIEDEMIGDIT